jgi:hypothetical protein
MLNINLNLASADVTRLEIALCGMRDKCYDRMAEMRQTKLELMRKGQWHISTAVEWTTYYEYECSDRDKWTYLLDEIKAARNESMCIMKPNPYVKEA